MGEKKIDKKQILKTVQNLNSEFVVLVSVKMRLRVWYIYRLRGRPLSKSPHITPH
jgi:hypothetical protein